MRNIGVSLFFVAGLTVVWFAIWARFVYPGRSDAFSTIVFLVGEIVLCALVVGRALVLPTTSKQTDPSARDAASFNRLFH